MVSNSLNDFNIYNETDEKLDKEIKKIKEVITYALEVEKVTNSTFNIIIVDNEKIREINKTYRNIDKTTDVISFALEDKKDGIKLNTRVLGDIYISKDKAISQAKEYGHSTLREFSFLSVHGLLHLLGYDHMNKEDEKIMFEKQELILNEQGLWKRFKKEKEPKKIH